jgi:DNA polymerase
MVNGMMNVTKAGYPIVLTVHDEAVAERPVGEGSLEEFEALMVQPAPWMRGLPLAAEGYVSTRYRK